MCVVKGRGERLAGDEGFISSARACRRRYRSESFLPQTYQTFLIPCPQSSSVAFRLWLVSFKTFFIKSLTPTLHHSFSLFRIYSFVRIFFLTFTSLPPFLLISSLHPRVLSLSCDGSRTDIVWTVGREGVEVTAHRIKLQHRCNTRCEDRAIVSNRKTKVPSSFLLNRRRDCHNHDF